MKIRESVGKSLWNSSLGWCCESLDSIPLSHIALAVKPTDMNLVDWDIEEIGEKAGFDIEYRYTGVNDPKDSSLACVTQASRYLWGLVKDRSRFRSFDGGGHPAPSI